ncbi:unnamed protein product [Laminaria digitata]
MEGCSYFHLRYIPRPAQEANATRGDQLTEVSHVVTPPLPRVEEQAASSRAYPIWSSAVVASDFWRAPWDSGLSYSYEGKIAVNLDFPTTLALVAVGFWEVPWDAGPIQTGRHLYQDPNFFSLRYERPPAQDAPTRDERPAEPGSIVPIPLSGKWPRREEGAAPPGAIPVARTVVPLGFWRGPWGASPSTGEFDQLGKELSLLPAPSAISNHDARLKELDVNPGNTTCPLVGSLAACGLALFVLVCRRRFRQRRSKRAAIVLHAMARRGLARRRLRHFAEVVRGVQARRRGRAATHRYRQQQRAAVVVHAVGRGGLVRRRLYRLAQVVRLQSWTRGRVAVCLYRQQQRAAVILHALGRRGLVRRRLYRLAQVVRLQSWTRGRVAVCHYRQQQRAAIILHALGRGGLVRRRLYRLAQVVRLQSWTRGRVAVCHYRQQQRAAIILHALGRGVLVRRCLYLEQAVRLQSWARGCVAVCHYRQQQHAAVVLHALGRGMLVRRRLYLARVVRLQSLWRRRVAILQCRQQQRGCVILQELARRVLARTRARRLREATAAAMAAITSHDAFRQCADAPEAGKGGVGPVSTEKGTPAGGAEWSTAAPKVGGHQASGRGEPGQASGQSVAASTPSSTNHPGARAAPKKTSRRFRGSKANDLLGFTVGEKKQRQEAGLGSFERRDQGLSVPVAGGVQRSAAVPQVGRKMASVSNVGEAQRSAAVPQVSRQLGTPAGGAKRSAAAPKVCCDQASGRGAPGPASGPSVAASTPSPTGHPGARTAPKKNPRRFKGAKADDLLGFTVGEKNQHQDTGLGSCGRRDQGPSRQRAPGQGSSRGIGSYTPPPTTTPGAKAGAPLKQGQRAPGQGSGQGMGLYTPPPTTTPGAKGGAPLKQVAAAGGARRSAAVPPTPPSIAGTKKTSGGAARGAQLSAAVPQVSSEQPSVSGRPLLKMETLWESKKPAICDESRWYDGCRLIIDNDGNCFGLSWMTTALVWAAQSRLHSMDLIKQLADAGKEGGAFCDLGNTCRGYIADLVSYAEGLVGAWEKRPAAQSTTEFGISLAVGVVRTLRGRSKSGSLIQGKRGGKPLWLKLKWGMTIAARALDVFAAPRGMDEADLVKLHTFGESIEIDVGSKYALLSTATEPATFSPSETVMRPGRGLKFVVGMIVDSITKRKEPVIVDSTTSAEVEPGITYAEVEVGISEDYTGFFSTLAVNEPCVPDLTVLKAGLPHFDVFVANGHLGDALVTEFELSAASSVATLAVIKEQLESQEKATVADLEREGTVSKAELDGQEAMWKAIEDAREKAQKDKSDAGQKKSQEQATVADPQLEGEFSREEIDRQTRFWKEIEDARQKAQKGKSDAESGGRNR